MHGKVMSAGQTVGQCKPQAMLCWMGPALPAGLLRPRPSLALVARGWAVSHSFLEYNGGMCVCARTCVRLISNIG